MARISEINGQTNASRQNGPRSFLNRFAAVADRRYRAGMKIAIIGAGGRLGAALVRGWREKFEIVGFDRRALDLADPDKLRQRIGALNADTVINCAALTNVDCCETHREEAFRVNADAPRVLAEICRDKEAKLIHIGTDYVFDGEKREPYREEDEARPISVYGESKLAGEESVLAVHDRHLVARVSWVFGPDRPSFVDGVIKRALENENVDAIADKFSAPSYTNDIAEALLGLIEVDARGTVHFSNTGECSWQEYGQWALDCCLELGIQLKATRVASLKLSDMRNFVARRPVYSVLSTAKYATLTGQPPRAWRDAVADYITRSYCKL
jgi:dTDP-4-dehydrorhamnose reductase